MVGRHVSGVVVDNGASVSIYEVIDLVLCPTDTGRSGSVFTEVAEVAAGFSGTGQA